MVNWTKVAAGVIGAAALLLLAYAVLTPETTDEERMGMGGPEIYTSENMGLIIVSSIVITITIAFILTYEKYEPVPPSYALRPPPQTGPAQPPEPEAHVRTSAEPPPPPRPEKAREDAKERYLVLRLLTGDERTMFKALMDAGGEALQKDLITSTKMSNAKVSRLLDKLEQKGVVTKERFGSTNRIRIKLEP